MTDAELIYNACLRVERKQEERIKTLVDAGCTPAIVDHLRTIVLAIGYLREEIGNGLAEQRPQ